MAGQLQTAQALSPYKRKAIEQTLTLSLSVKFYGSCLCLADYTGDVVKRLFLSIGMMLPENRGLEIMFDVQVIVLCFCDVADRFE